MMNEISGTPQKLAKLVARAGYASRREAEKLISEGKVMVDGKMVNNVAERFPVSVKISVLGDKQRTIEPSKVYRYHKPRGLITSHRDEHDRPTVFAHLPKHLPHVISVGRLDLDSEGLLLLTNDGELAGRLEKSNLPRHYRVRMQGTLHEAQIARLAQGIVAEGVFYAPIAVKVERQQGANSWLSVKLTEGKNREIRKVFQYLGYRVNRLIRTGFSGVSLGDLAVGDVEPLAKKALNDLVSRLK